MEKIIIIGTDSSRILADNLGASLEIFTAILGNNADEIDHFVTNRLKERFDILIIDADNLQSEEIALAIGMYVRLSFSDIGENSLRPIIIASDKTLKQFLHIKTYSQLLLTEGVFFQQRTNLITDGLKPLLPDEYKDLFLNEINILPPPEYGNHSLSNQWGASVLDRLISGGIQSDNKSISESFHNIYFKFVLAKTINLSDLFSDVAAKRFYIPTKSPINAVGKRILLIDDEADKGWGYALKRMIKTKEGDFDVINHKAKDYNDFTLEEQRMIEEKDYDLIFLDLRMAGIEEESNYRPEQFSGMKILKHIKEQSIGTQVIILTASNKVWNLKSLLNAGADGYYLKESPEYNFSIAFSSTNYDALRDSIERCLYRSYIKEIDKTIKGIDKSFLLSTNDDELKNSIITQLRTAFELIKLAETEEQYAFAYISLYFVIETINKEKKTEILTNYSVVNEKIFLDKDECGNSHYWDTNTSTLISSKKMILSKEILLDYSLKKDSEYQFIFDENGNIEKISQIDYNQASEFIKIANTMKYYGMDDQPIIDIYHRIRARNHFIHNDKSKIENNMIEKQIFTEHGFLSLLKTIEKICSYL